MICSLSELALSQYSFHFDWSHDCKTFCSATITFTALSNLHFLTPPCSVCISICLLSFPFAYFRLNTTSPEVLFKIPPLNVRSHYFSSSPLDRFSLCHTTFQHLIYYIKLCQEPHWTNPGIIVEISTHALFLSPRIAPHPLC